MSLLIVIAPWVLIAVAAFAYMRRDFEEKFRRVNDAFVSASRENGTLRDRLAVSLAFAYTDSAVKFPGLVRPFVSGDFVYGGNSRFAFRAGVRNAESCRAIHLPSASSSGISGKLVDIFGEWDSADDVVVARCWLTADDFQRAIRSAEQGSRCFFGANGVWVVVPGDPCCVVDLLFIKLLYLAMVASETNGVKVEYASGRKARFSAVPDDSLVSFSWRVVFQDRTDLSGDRMCGVDECVVCAEDGSILHASGDSPVSWESLRVGGGSPMVEEEVTRP